LGYGRERRRANLVGEWRQRLQVAVSLGSYQAKMLIDTGANSMSVVKSLSDELWAERRRGPRPPRARHCADGRTTTEDGKDPVKTVDIERDGPNGQWAILYYTESGNILNRRSQYYIETVAYAATSYWRGVLKINSAIVDQGVIWVDSTTGVYTYQETIRKNGEIIVDMTARGCVRLDQPDVAAPAQTPAVQSTPVPAPKPITAPRERCEQYYGTAACDHAVAPQPLSGMGESAVPMISDGGTFKVPVTINRQLTLNFVVDSGAADVSIPADVFMTLVRTGTITDADFLDKQTYQLADGSTIPSQRFVIRTLKIGDKTWRTWSAA
jgi:predicted aspartyl protease